MRECGGGESRLATVTHARLRASQGDVDVARAILRAILAESPDDPEARLLLEELGDLRGTGLAEREEEPLAPPRPARASEIRRRFQAALGGGEAGETRRVRRRLEAFLARVRESRGVTGAR